MAEAVWTSALAGKKQDDILGGEKTAPLSPVSGIHQPSVASKMSPPKDAYWFAQTAETVGKVRQVPKASPVEKDESPTQEQLSPSHKPYMDKQSDLHLEGVSPMEKLYVPPRAATPSRLDSYWFAHSGIDLSSPTADQASDSGYSDGKESSPPSLQRERKSHQEQDQYFEGRQKQPKQLRTFTVQADAFHEYESNYRQPKAEHYHDQLRYPASEEKRSYIWDTKMESKEAALKQGFDQKAKLEARRNAQRNHLSFAFGSSTQDDHVDDRTNVNGHPSYQGSEVIFPIIQNIDEGDGHGDKRTDMSSYNLIQKIDDCMSRSVIITSTTRGRKKTDLVPAMPLNRSTFSRMPSPGNQAKRSISMSRLDQLAQPRRHYVEAHQEMGKNASSSGSHSFATSMSKSMYYVDNSQVHGNKKTLHVSSVSKSMLHLTSHQPPASGSSLPPNPQLYSASSLKNSKRLSQSMMQLSVMPRPTRASLLRAEALATAREKGLSLSTLLLNRNDAFGSRLSLVPAVRKEPSHSPARPRSSLSATAEAIPEKSQTPKVTMRSKPKSRPRPVSIAGTVPDQPPKASAPATKDAKPTKHPEKKGPGTSSKPPTAKAASSAAVSKLSSTQKVPETAAAKEEVDQSVTPEPVPEVEVEPEHESEPEPKESLPCESKTIIEVESPAVPSEAVPEPKKEDEMTNSMTKSRITSEEEAKAALQEKRRLAREQAEREAELERLRQEEIRRKEEEQRRKEEEEQRRQEEEQLRLMEELQRQEEEKLKKAIEEKQKREEEERLRQEEENRLKAEKEEQERIAREEAERQRIELVERLKREEEERAERKRRVEQIMSRTRGKASSTQQSDASSEKTQITSRPFETAAKLTSSVHLPSSVLSALSSIHGGSLIKGKNENLPENNNLVSETPEKDEERENNKQQSIVNNDSKTETEYSQEIVSSDGLRSQEDNINDMTADRGVPMVINNVEESERELSCDKIENIDVHHQTNGYSEDNETERSGNGSSDKRSETTTNSTNVIKAVQPSPGKEPIDSNLEQVIQLEDNTTGKMTVSIDDNLLNKVEDVNSNTVPGTPIVAFEEVRQPQASITG